MSDTVYDVAARLQRQIALSVPAIEAAVRAQRILQGSPAVMDLATNPARYPALILTQARLAQASSVMAAAMAARAAAIQAHPAGVAAIYLDDRRS